MHQGHHLLDPSADPHLPNQGRNPGHHILNDSFSGFSLCLKMLINFQLNIPKMAILEFDEKKLMKKINNLILLI